MSDVSAVVATLDSAWRTQWGDTSPIGSDVRLLAPERWVRFHSLPASKRYAENAAEYDELLSRHLTILGELTAATSTPTTSLRAVTAAWSGSPGQTDRESELAAIFPATYWQTVPYDLTAPDFQMWIHLYVGETTIDADELRELLLLAADYGTSDVIICPPDASWLYHPYDGGGDVLAPDQATRDRLRDRHAAWLSAESSGL